jgi:hypothetical protein
MLQIVGWGGREKIVIPMSEALLAADKNIVFTSVDGKNQEVVFGVLTSENNVFALLKQGQ